MLHELDRIDKHRLVHSTMTSFSGTTWDFQRATNVRAIGPGLIQSLSGPIETDTPIARIYGIHPIGPSTEVHVEIHPSIGIAFAQGTPCVEGEPVMQTLSTIYNYVTGTVLNALRQFV
jgi:hypothetical protein